MPEYVDREAVKKIMQKYKKPQGTFWCPLFYIAISNIIFQPFLIQYHNFYIPQLISPLHCPPSIFHHFSPLLSIHLFHCGKCGKTCGKLTIFACKYPINHRKIPINAQKPCQDVLFVFFISCFILFYFLFVRCSDRCIPYILGTHGSHTLLCPKRLSVFSPRPLTSFGSPSNCFSFIEPTVLK